MKIKLLWLLAAIIFLVLMHVTFVGAEDYYPANKEWHLWKLQRGEDGMCRYYVGHRCKEDKDRTWKWLGEQKYPSSWACARAARPWERQGNIIACLPRGMRPYDIDL